MSAVKEKALYDAQGTAYQLHGMLKCLRMAAEHSESVAENTADLRAFNYLGLSIDSMIPIANAIIDGIESGQTGKTC